mgnify:CR=1 FL=1
MKRIKPPALSTIVASHHHVSRRHARRLIVAGDTRVAKTLGAMTEPAVAAIGNFVISLAAGIEGRYEVNFARLELARAVEGTMFPPKFRRRVQAAFDALIAAEDAYDRALTLWHDLDSETSATGLLHAIAIDTREADAALHREAGESSLINS